MCAHRGPACGLSTAYFGIDDVSFKMTSPGPGLILPVRQYETFSQALEDALFAKIYGGMHYRSSTEHGSQLGRHVARQMVENFFLPQ